MRSTALVGRSFLLIGVLALGGLCLASEGFAQEGDPNGAAIGSGSVVAPSPWLNVNVPVQERVALKLYGFFIGGELDVPSAQVDVPVRTTKFLTITPSYLYYSVRQTVSTSSLIGREHSPTAMTNTSFASTRH
jgi:hypothetical protein